MMTGQGGATTRRRFVRDAGVTTLAAAELLAAPAHAKRRRRESVAVFGGGVAGLTAAHELAERGFDVTVFEPRAWGGKARSTVARGTAAGGRRPLPGEHAYRIEFGCYHNLSDTMRRIPFKGNANGVFDNMVPIKAIRFAQDAGSDFYLPMTLEAQDSSPAGVLSIMQLLLLESGISPADASYLAGRLAVFLSSCDARRHDDWERTSWWDFIGSDNASESYRRIFGKLWEYIQGTKSQETCARYPASVFETWVVYPLLGRGTTGAAIRHLDAPTNEAWIQPWTAYLRALGVKLRLGQRVSRLRFQHGRITGAQVQTPSGIRHVQADHYVVAMPVEYARRLWTPAMMRAEPALRRMRRLGVGRYHGVSFFLREPANVFDGIVACSDSPWSVNFVTQQQLWRHDISQRYGDGTVHDKLSTVVANWEEPGILYGKPAEACTPDELARELWAQIQAANGELAGVQPHSWLLDDGLRHRPRAGHWQHIDRLVMPQVNTERYRPEARTEIPNLVLSGDYLKTPYEIANMESAAYSGRRAANAVLSASRSHETPAATIEPYRPPEWESMKTMDADRYARGEKNVLDQALPLDDIQALANTLSQP